MRWAQRFTLQIAASSCCGTKLLREMNAMTKAVAYKQRIDQQNKSDVQTAADELKAQFFSALGTEHPDLYRQLVQILERKSREAEA